MTSNRSAPTDTVLPHIMCRDIVSAIEWLTRVFGFREHYRYGDPVSGAQMYAGKACIMLKSRPDQATPAALGYGTQSLTIFLDDVASHYTRSRAEGAKIVEELHETVYGERQYGVIDMDGHHWLFSQHARDLGPEDWGATLARH